MTSEVPAQQSSPEGLRRRFVVHRDVRAVRVGDEDARGWLNDLVTADVAGLGPGELRPSLLLGPTGRIRATFAIVADVGGEADSFLLLQDGNQISVAALLAPYVLSSRVRIAPDDRVALSLPEGSARAESVRPSLLSVLALGQGWGATELLAPAEAEALASRLAAEGLAEIGAGEVDRMRIDAGVPLLGVDLDELSLPAEAGWEDRIDLTKGCFLGQESVAKIRNLGHPPRVVLAVSGPAGTSPGDEVLAGGAVVGVVTSVGAAAGEGIRALVRIRWEAREADLSTAVGSLLRTA